MMHLPPPRCAHAARLVCAAEPRRRAPERASRHHLLLRRASQRNVLRAATAAAAGAVLSKTTYHLVVGLLTTHCLLLTTCYLLLTTYRAGAALEDQGRGERAGELRAGRAAALGIPGCNPMSTRLQPYVSQASFARGGLLLADYINAMSTAMCAVKVRWSRIWPANLCASPATLCTQHATLCSQTATLGTRLPATLGARLPDGGDGGARCGAAAADHP